MAGKQAKVLSDRQIDDLLLFAETTRRPLRNKIVVLLSTKAITLGEGQELESASGEAGGRG